MKRTKIILLVILVMFAGCKNNDKSHQDKVNNTGPELTGKTADAILTVEKIRSLSPDELEFYYSIALNYAEAKDEKVLALTDSLIKADSPAVHAEPYYYKGIYYSNINDPKNAILQFDTAIQRNYNFLDAYIEKAAVLYDMKAYTEGIRVLNLALTISPGLADAWYWLGKIQEAAGDRENARTNYLKAYELDKSLIEAKQGADRL